MPEKDLPPDHLRCKRTDGRQWRCSRRALDGLTLCEIHHLQGRHRQKKQKVPDSLKIERSYSKQRKNGDKGGVSKLTKMQLSVEKRKRCQSEALDETLKRMKLRKGDLQLELIRVFLKRQVEKKKERALKETAIGETMRVLPNGVMAISHSPLNSQELINQNGVLDVKLGLDLNLSLSSQRNFRSKNIEPLPIGTMQVVPFSRSVKKRKIKRCHWCRESNKLNMIKCLSCRKRFFCADCLKERYFERLEVKEKCPACHGTCTCMICQKQQSKAINHKECPRSKRRVDRNHLLHYLINILLPVLKQMNHDQSAEMEIEARVSGSEVQIPQVNLGFQNLQCCNCKTSITDYHRSCTKCSYNICLSCLELCRESLYGGFKLKSCKKKKPRLSDDELLLKINNNISRQSSGGMSSLSPVSLQKWKANADGSISCPSVDVGGCGNSLLNLRCVFPSTWTRELEVRAEKILCSYHFPGFADVSLFCSFCKGIDHEAGVAKTLREMSSRVGSNDNYLYCPTLQDLHQETLEHFQKHWGMGHPVIVQNILKSTSGLCWDPFTMFCSYIENRGYKANNEDSEATNCSDWCEVEIDRKQIFMGSLEKSTHASVRHKTLKFKASFSSSLFQKQFPAHYNEILHALPLPEYINPVSGLLNLAVKLPKELQKTNLGPCIYISYGGPEELMQADFLTKLCYESHDTVNILAYATDVPISQEQITKIGSLMKKCKSRDPHGKSAGNSTDQKGKSPLPSEEGTGKLGLLGVDGDRMQISNGIHSSDSLKGNALSVEDETMSLDSESDSEESMICCGTIEKSEDTDEYFLAEDIESSCSSEDKRGNNSCGAQWDVFRRQDVPKLLEYLKLHSNELSHTCYSKHVVHPILDQNFYLDAFHKLKLKEEFGIQPWTFEQHSGEAIIIPAGCPYQIKKLKSCVGVVLDFISPENATQCIKLSDEIRLLPMRHKARERLLEVKRMTLHGINAAIEDICNIMHSEK